MVQWLRYVLITVGLALLIFLIWYLRDIVSYIIVSWVLSMIGAPLMDFLSKQKIKKFKIPRGLLAAFTVLLTWTIIVMLFVLLIPVVMQQAKEIAGINVQDIINNLQEPIQKIEAYIDKFGLLGKGNNVSVDDYLRQKMVALIDISSVSDILSFITSMFGNVFVAIFSISFITFFFLKEEDLFTRMLLLFIPQKYEEHTLKALNSIKHLLSRYFIGISVEIFLIMLLVTIGLLIVGLEFQHALIIGVFAGLINVIPYVGPLLGILFGLFIGLATHLSYDFFNQLLPLLGFMTLVFVIVQLIDNALFQPLIYSSSVNAHPLEIFLVIMITANLVGVGGMILAVPGYTVLRVILKEFFSQLSVVQKITERIDK